jgi:hypothetical protein
VVTLNTPNAGHNPAAEEYYQTQLPRNSPFGSHINAKQISLHLPSHLGYSWYDRNAAKDLAKAELHLWEGQLDRGIHSSHLFDNYFLLNGFLLLNQNK